MRSASCSSYPRDGEPKCREQEVRGTGKRSNFRPKEPRVGWRQGTREGAAEKKLLLKLHKFPQLLGSLLRCEEQAIL